MSVEPERAPDNVIRGGFQEKIQKRNPVLDLSIQKLFAQSGIPEEIAVNAAQKLCFVACDTNWSNVEKNVENMLKFGGRFGINTTGYKGIFNSFYRDCNFDLEKTKIYCNQVIAKMQELGLLYVTGQVREELGIEFSAYCGR